eukprot:11865735-Prorocentrum_lima.AAC.1
MTSSLVGSEMCIRDSFKDINSTTVTPREPDPQHRTTLTHIKKILPTMLRTLPHHRSPGPDRSRNEYWILLRKEPRAIHNLARVLQRIIEGQ